MLGRYVEVVRHGKTSVNEEHAELQSLCLRPRFPSQPPATNSSRWNACGINHGANGVRPRPRSVPQYPKPVPCSWLSKLLVSRRGQQTSRTFIDRHVRPLLHLEVGRENCPNRGLNVIVKRTVIKLRVVVPDHQQFAFPSDETVQIEVDVFQSFVSQPRP